MYRVPITTMHYEQASQTNRQTNEPTKRFSCMHHLPPRWQGYFGATMLRSRRKEKKKTATPFSVFVGSTAARCSPFPFLRGQPPVLVPLATEFRCFGRLRNALSFVQSKYWVHRLSIKCVDQPDDLGLIGKKLPTIKEGLRMEHKVSKTTLSFQIPSSKPFKRKKTHILCVSLLIVKEKQHLTLSPAVPLFKFTLPSVAVPISGLFKLQLVKIAFWL